MVLVLVVWLEIVVVENAVVVDCTVEVDPVTVTITSLALETDVKFIDDVLAALEPWKSISHLTVEERIKLTLSLMSIMAMTAAMTTTPMSQLPTPIPEPQHIVA